MDDHLSIEYPFSNLDFSGETPPPEHWPSRSAAAIVMILPDLDNRIFVTNMHPETWNHWMLPFVAAYSDLPATVSSANGLHQVLADLAAQLSRDPSCDPALKLSDFGFRVRSRGRYVGSPEHVVRYSMRLERWTAYRFAYLLLDKEDWSTVAETTLTKFARPESESAETRIAYSAPALEAFRRVLLSTER